MKDSIVNHIPTSDHQFYTKTADSIHKDLNGIRCEIVEYTKSQKQDKSFVSNDTIFTVIVTLSVFILGILIDRLLKFCDKIKNEKERREFFIFHLKRTDISLVTKLRDAYLEYSQNTTIDTGISSTPPKILSSDLQRLLNTNFEELFKAYKAKEVLSKILSRIEFIDKVQIEVSNFHDRVYAGSGDIRDELEKLSDEYLRTLSEYTKYEKNNTADYENSETFKLIYKSIQVYYTEIAGTRQLSRFHKDIIRAIQEHIVKTGEYQTHAILKDVAEKGRMLSRIVSKLTQQTEEITTQYKTFSDYMDETTKAFATLIPELK